MSRLLCVSLMVWTIGISNIALAQTPASAPPSAQPSSNIKRTLLQTVDVPGTSFNAITGIAEIVPNANIGRHTHPGVETGYVIEGDLFLLVEGQPPMTLKAGESYQIRSGAVHDGKSGDKGAKLMAVYVVEKGKPLATPAP